MPSTFERETLSAPHSQRPQNIAEVIAENPDTLGTPPSSHNCLMADILPSEGKKGRRPIFSPQQHLEIVRELAATNAHIPDLGNKKKLFPKAAGSFNRNPSFDDPVDYRAVQDRYMRLQTSATI